MQDATPNANAVALVVIGLTALVYLALGIKKLLKKDIDPDKQFVTREELGRTVCEFNEKLERLESEIKAELEKAEKYAHETTHKLREDLHGLGLNIERLLVLTRRHGEQRGEQ